MEVRPIDANALYDALRDNEFQTFCPLDEVDDVIAAAPTLDYAPVVHGEWLWDGNRGTYCSRCKKTIPSVQYYSWDDEMAEEEIDETPFCPNCGAKMGAEMHV